ncbi:hypothetical protein KR100_06680 [Synechococcus sp. KORDI-100]|nr:hypothetical protein KR100_06680 [Synechococcus sp. KORDI-100]
MAIQMQLAFAFVVDDAESDLITRLRVLLGSNVKSNNRSASSDSVSVL